MKFFTLKNLLVSLVVICGVIFLTITSFKVSNICSDHSVYEKLCRNTLVLTRDFSFVLFLVLLPSLLTVAKNQAFIAWFRFALFGVPFVLIFTWWNLNQSAGFMGLGAGVLFGQLVAVYGIYFLISLTIIARTWREEK